ncbi:hypothetical protein DVA86_17785 [Streptomyces armeniacus]|uniref:Activator of Hsp90 ATPase homologue 1/2-like C-terminal domain-containing protein n=1 Tax=Streptomyces armeniacus TaxID=83291 RepID=A0A345XRF9_9ACTN|nr:SRPBCC domain-containing protein [Streptomyces armeniacus]AXK34225.1 hypothetical protein DVA86_17785 [Streptomyces armeniacus]
MTIRNLGDETTTMTAEGADLKMERSYDAAASVVWDALTSAEHIPGWWGPRGTTAKVGEMDVKAGGKWAVTPAAEQGGTITFSGEFKEVVEGERFVRTSGSDADPSGTPAVETFVLAEAGGKTTLKYEVQFPSAEVLDTAVEYGMAQGVIEQFDRLAELAAKLG